MADQSKDGHTTAVERVAANKRDARRGPHDGAVIDMLTQAMSYASKDGHTRDLVAERLGCSVSTLRAYIDPDRDNRLHLDTAIRMVRDREILGDDARMYLAHEIVGEMGLACVVIDADGDDSSVASQFLEVSKWMGEVAHRTAEAGDEIDQGEKERIAEGLRQLQREAAELLGKVTGGVS